MYNLTGWPSVTVRVGTSPEGLPLGVQVAARPWRENVALALAAHLENTFGGWKMPTPCKRGHSGYSSFRRPRGKEPRVLILPERRGNGSQVVR
jgi:hypothetical protein